MPENKVKAICHNCGETVQATREYCWREDGILYTDCLCLEGCAHQDPDDGTCSHPANRTAECHTDACPYTHLQARLAKMFEGLPS